MKRRPAPKSPAGTSTGWTMNRGTLSGCFIIKMPGGICDLTGMRLPDPPCLYQSVEGAPLRERIMLAWEVAKRIIRGRL